MPPRIKRPSQPSSPSDAGKTAAHLFAERFNETYVDVLHGESFSTAIAIRVAVVEGMAQSEKSGRPVTADRAMRDAEDLLIARNIAPAGVPWEPVPFPVGQ